MSVEVRGEMENGQKNILTIIIPLIAVLVFTVMVYLLLDPFLKMTHTSVSSFLQQPIGIMVIFIWILGCVFLWIGISQYTELWVNPLTPEEENDPLLREVVINGSFDKAYDLCLKAPYAVGRWWLMLPDRPKMSLSAYWIGMVQCHIRISLSKLAEDQYRVVITGTRYFQMYEKTGSPTTWERYPQLAFGKDSTRRKCIHSLDGIQNFLLKQKGE